MNRKEIRGKQQEKKDSVFRVQQICELLSHGYNSNEINNFLQSPIDIAQKRGYLSVYNIQKSIKDFSFISEIQETKPNGYLDSYDKYDLIVFLKEKNIKYIGIQVKSSFDQVLKFYKKINSDPQTVLETLAQKKLIVLNGQLPPSQIQRTFLHQLDHINNFYQNTSKTESI